MSSLTIRKNDITHGVRKLGGAASDFADIQVQSGPHNIVRVYGMVSIGISNSETRGVRLLARLPSCKGSTYFRAERNSLLLKKRKDDWHHVDAVITNDAPWNAVLDSDDSIHPLVRENFIGAKAELAIDLDELLRGMGSVKLDGSTIFTLNAFRRFESGQWKNYRLSVFGFEAISSRWMRLFVRERLPDTPSETLGDRYQTITFDLDAPEIEISKRRMILVDQNVKSLLQLPLTAGIEGQIFANVARAALLKVGLDDIVHEPGVLRFAYIDVEGSVILVLRRWTEQASVLEVSIDPQGNTEVSIKQLDGKHMRANAKLLRGTVHDYHVEIYECGITRKAPTPYDLFEGPYPLRRLAKKKA